jgi:hypothetical protein
VVADGKTKLGAHGALARVSQIPKRFQVRARDLRCDLDSPR